MSHVVNIDERGVIALPEEVLAKLGRPARYVLEIAGETLILRPQRGQPAWALPTPEERVRAFQEWVARQGSPGPNLPDEALRRENLYD